MSVPYNTTTTATFETLDELNDKKARQRMPTIVFLCILIAFGVIGNIVVLVVYGLRYRPSTFRSYILTLAVIDLLSCLIAMPVELVDNLYPLQFFSEEVCKGGRFLGHVFKIGSALIILVMAVGRFRKICRPFSKQISINQAHFLCALAMGLAILFAWPNAIVQGMRKHYFDGGVIGYDCSVDDDVSKTIYPFIYAIVLFTVYISVFSSLVTLYTLIILRIRSHNNAEQKLKRMKINPRVTKVMIAITVAFIVSYIPDCIMDANYTFNQGNTLPSTPLVLALLPLLARAYFINNVINPLIYLIGETKFRKIVKLSMIWVLRSLQRRDTGDVFAASFSASDTFRTERMATYHKTSSSNKSQPSGNHSGQVRQEISLTNT